MNEAHFSTANARYIWDTRYRHRDGDVVHDRDIEDTWRRIARALAAAEPRDGQEWQRRFYQVLERFRFLPGGRILAGAGTGHRVTLFNCFVMGVIHDSMDSIFDNLKEGALTMQQGGGVGYDFSTLRPRGTRARSTGSIASGPVSFMRIWDSMCATLLSTGARRGAMMATLRCDHPDIEEFVEAKQTPGELRHFNLSVQVTDAFVEAVRNDREWPLVFPVAELDEAASENGQTVRRWWTGHRGPVACRILRRVRARELWDRIMRATYDYAEPGVLFVDRINHANNLAYCERITATNPCGEIPLPPYGACDLGAINLTHFVRDPFTPDARLDLNAVAETAAVAVRMLDDVIEISRFPLDRQAQEARGSRRVGLGVTGLADALVLLGLHYASAEARKAAAEAMRTICHAAYRTSVELAREKGSFPFLDREKYLRGRFVRSLPDEIRDAVARHGIRNSHLIAIAPTGTISLLAGNVSSGIEPVYRFTHTRRILEPDGTYSFHELTDYAYRLWLERKGPEAPLPEAFVDAAALDPMDHLEMQAALQPYVDNAISKTINVPEAYPFESFRSLYEAAYDRGLKGCTTFRPNPVTGAVLETAGPEAEEGALAPHCCSIERETD